MLVGTTRSVAPWATVSPLRSAKNTSKLISTPSRPAGVWSTSGRVPTIGVGGDACERGEVRDERAGGDVLAEGDAVDLLDLSRASSRQVHRRRRSCGRSGEVPGVVTPARSVVASRLAAAERAWACQEPAQGPVETDHVLGQHGQLGAGGHLAGAASVRPSHGGGVHLFGGRAARPPPWTAAALRWAIGGPPSGARAPRAATRTTEPSRPAARVARRRLEAPGVSHREAVSRVRTPAGGDDEPSTIPTGPASRARGGGDRWPGPGRRRRWAARRAARTGAGRLDEHRVRRRRSRSGPSPGSWRRRRLRRSRLHHHQQDGAVPVEVLRPPQARGRTAPDRRRSRRGPGEPTGRSSQASRSTATPRIPSGHRPKGVARSWP